MLVVLGTASIASAGGNPPRDAWMARLESLTAHRDFVTATTLARDLDAAGDWS